MDLNLYGRVMRRFWWVIIPGLVLGAALAFLSLVRVSPDGLTYRKPQVWQSQSVLLLTQTGFPWGRTLLPPLASGSAPGYADPNRFSSLTDLYSQFANSDSVRTLMHKEGAPSAWTFSAAPVPPTIATSTLPMIALSGRANSGPEAVSAVTYGRRALIEYMERQQQIAKIPAAQRINLQIVRRASPPVVVVPRKKTVAIVVFLAVAVAAVGLAFVLENLRPPVRAVTAQRARARRTA